MATFVPTTEHVDEINVREAVWGTTVGVVVSVNTVGVNVLAIECERFPRLE